MIAMNWGRSLDGIADVPWGTMLRSNAPALVAAFTRLAGHTGPGPALDAADAIDDLIADEVDYGYASDAIECGYWPAGVPAIGFLARIAAAHPSDAATEAAVELIDKITHAPMDRPGASEAELDAWVDGLRDALRDAQPALNEAARLVPTAARTIEALGGRSGGALAYAGSYEPRWRGVAREVARLPAYSIKAVVGDGRDLLVVSDRYFLDPRTGDVVATFTAPRPGRAVAFADVDGPGVLTVAGPRREGGHRGPLRLWRHTQRGWQATLIGPRLRPWPLLPAIVSMAADDGGLYLGHSNGTVTRRDGRTGNRNGPTLRVPAPGWHHRLETYRDGSRRRLISVDRDNVYDLDFAQGRAAAMPIDRFRPSAVPFRLAGRLCLAILSGGYPPGPVWRFDAVSGAAIGPPITLRKAMALGAYTLDDRSMLAVGSGRQIHRFDAETGEPVGPPLNGHRRDVTGIAAVRISGRVTLFSVDGATVRRWDAASGTPWPASLPA